MELVAADELQQCLRRAHNPLDAVALLLRACLPSSSTDYVQTLEQHGFKRAFFDCIDDHTPPVRAPRVEALRRLHAIEATRLHLTMPGVVSSSILSEFGPRRGRESLETARSCSKSKKRPLAASSRGVDPRETPRDP